MKNLIVYKRSLLSILILLITGITSAQKKYLESFEVTDDATITVNTSHTNIIFETWNKNKVEVEAFIEGDELSEKEKQDIFDNWKFEVLGNSSRVVISSMPQLAWGGDFVLPNLEAMPKLEFLEPLMANMPMITRIEMPELPKDMMRNMGDLQFNMEEFNKDKDAYMKKWNKEIEKKFGKDFEKKMEKWGEDFAKEWNEKNGDKIAAEWEEKMKVWNEKFGEDMEKWAEEFENKYKDHGDFSKEVITTPNGDKTILLKGSRSGIFEDGKAKKTIIIRMPKNSKTEINVRHGEIKMADALNVKATLNYTPFTANSIGGGQTLINAAYAPVIVENWNYGTLYIKFVENCSIGTVESINLRSNTSDVLIGTITKDANLTGSLGNFKINDISKDFDLINISLKNNDAELKMPNVAFTFLYEGKRSTLKYPKSLKLSNTKQGDQVIVSGYNKNASSEGKINFTSLFSNIQVY